MRPLHYAAWYGHPSCVATLVAAGAEVNAHDHDGATPCHAGEAILALAFLAGL